MYFQQTRFALRHARGFSWEVADLGAETQAAAEQSAARALSSNTERCSVFETIPEIPLERASRSENTSLYSLNTIMGTIGMSRFNSQTASMPFIRGIERSSKIKSGRNTWAISTASS